MYRVTKQTKRDVLKRFREKMSYRRKVRTSIRRVSIRFENQQREDELNDKYFLISIWKPAKRRRIEWQVFLD